MKSCGPGMAKVAELIGKKKNNALSGKAGGKNPPKIFFKPPRSKSLSKLPEEDD
jgi:hypothetical protein